jgi:hypothetical protein
MAHTKLVIGTTKRRSAAAPAYVVRVRRTPIGRHLIDTANALAIVLFALADWATTRRKSRRTLATNGLGLDPNRPSKSNRKDKGHEEAQHTRRTLDCPG